MCLLLLSPWVQPSAVAYHVFILICWGRLFACWLVPLLLCSSLLGWALRVLSGLFFHGDCGTGWVSTLLLLVLDCFLDLTEDQQQIIWAEKRRECAVKTHQKTKTTTKLNKSRGFLPNSSWKQLLCPLSSQSATSTIQVFDSTVFWGLAISIWYCRKNKNGDVATEDVCFGFVLGVVVTECWPESADGYAWLLQENTWSTCRHYFKFIATVNRLWIHRVDAQKFVES